MKSNKSTLAAPTTGPRTTDYDWRAFSGLNLVRRRNSFV